MSDDDFCTCPIGRALGAPHLKGCPESEGEVLVFRQPDTGRPVGVPHDVISQADRVFRAYELHLEGNSWEHISHQDGGWPSAQAVKAEVTKYLEEGRGALALFKRTDIMQIWSDRLEMLWAAVIPEARNGKVPSVMAALSVAKTAMTLNQLDQASEEGLVVPTVVVPSEDYIAQLKLQAESKTA